MHERCSRRDCDERHTKWWRNNDVLKCMRMIDVGPFSYDYLLIYNSWLIERAQNIPFVFFFNYKIMPYTLRHSLQLDMKKKKWLEDYLQFCHWKRKEWVIWFPFSCNILIGVFFYIPLEFMYFVFFCTFAPGECVLNTF